MIIDLRDSHIKASFINFCQLYKGLSTITNLKHNHRLVILIKKEFCENNSKFAELVAINWGQGIFKIFRNYEYAVSWLNDNESIQDI